MFEDASTASLMSAIESHDFAADLGDSGASHIDAIVAYERLIRTAQARQAAHITALARIRHREGTAGDIDLGVVGEVAMARNVSPRTASAQYHLALGLTSLPHVATAFANGDISEASARAIVRETENLAPDDLTVLDAELAPRLPGLTTGRATDMARRMVIRLDADAARQRAETNRADQRVELCPDTDGVAALWVRGPAEHITAAHQALDRAARSLKAAGDRRRLGQIMCDTLIERVTGLARTDDLGVEVQVVIDLATLTGHDAEPADLNGYGPISAHILDHLLGTSRNAWVRRLITDPIDGTLVARDPRRRHFDGPSAGYLHTRDRRCRQPCCDSPATELDHMHEVQHGGPTTIGNGQGLCNHSHRIKSQPGWHVAPDPAGLLWRTPTGHTYHSPTPAVLPKDPPPRRC